MDGASISAVRSISCFLSTRTPMSICSAPELSIRSGGVPPLKRGCSCDWIFWVAVCLTLAFGKAAVYFFSASIAYCWPKPPSKMTTSSAAVSLTPSGFFALVLPFSTCLSPPSSLLAQADRKLIVGMVIRPSAAERLITSRRPRPSFLWPEVDPMLKSSPSPGLRRCVPVARRYSPQAKGPATAVSCAWVVLISGWLNAVGGTRRPDVGRTYGVLLSCPRVSPDRTVGKKLCRRRQV